MRLRQENDEILLEEQLTIEVDLVDGRAEETNINFALAQCVILKAGTNVLKLTIPAGGLTSGIMYDYLRLELNSSPVVSERATPKTE